MPLLDAVSQYNNHLSNTTSANPTPKFPPFEFHIFALYGRLDKILLISEPWNYPEISPQSLKEPAIEGHYPPTVYRASDGQVVPDKGEPLAHLIAPRTTPPAVYYDDRLSGRVILQLDGIVIEPRYLVLTDKRAILIYFPRVISSANI